MCSKRMRKPMKFNPMQNQKEESRENVVYPVGRYVCKAAGFRRATSKSGNPYINLRFSVINGPSSVFEIMIISEKMLWKWGQLCNALSVSEEFDLESDDDIDRLFIGNYLALKVGQREYNGETRNSVEAFYRLTNEEAVQVDSEDWDAINRSLRRLKKQSEPQPKEEFAANQDGGFDDDDIPF